MALLNRGVNIGHSSRLGYDKCYYNQRLSESVSPLLYKMDPNSTNNCNSCLSVFGPRPSSGPNSAGVSTFVSSNTIAPAQKLVDVDSILSNRNVIASKCREGQVNDINVTQYKLQHARVCNDFLNPLSTSHSHPRPNYRGMSINRFINLPKDPQVPIFYDFAVNTKLEAKDNYRERIPRLIAWDPTLPREIPGRNRPCRYQCYSNRCPQEGSCTARNM